MMKIQRLNLDNSWWIQLGQTKILVDPWLHGKEVDYFPWFNTQWHRTHPIDYNSLPEFDFILITQKYPDHYHKETLKKINPKKLIVPKSIAKSCQKLLPESEIVPFNNGVESAFGSDANIHFLSTKRKIDPIYDALIVENGNQSVFLATHGFALQDSQIEIANRFSPYDLLITPLNLYKLPVVLGGKVSPGVEVIKSLCEIIQPKKIVATHDEDKHAKGLVTKFAKVTKAPTKDILSQKNFFGKAYLEIEDYNLITL